MENLDDKPKKKPPAEEPILPFPDGDKTTPPQEDPTITPPEEKPAGGITQEDIERLYDDKDEPWWRR